MTTINLNTVTTGSFTRIKLDVNGNPRYYIDWLSFAGDYATACSIGKHYGLAKYRGKAFGAGFVAQSYSLQDTAEGLARSTVAATADVKLLTKNAKEWFDAEALANLQAFLYGRKITPKLCTDFCQGLGLGCDYMNYDVITKYWAGYDLDDDLCVDAVDFYWVKLGAIVYTLATKKGL